MPELLEIELYRRDMADLVGRIVDEVWCPDPWFIRRAGRPETVARAVDGATVTAVRRHGKLLLVDLVHEAVRAGGAPDAVVLGLRFGMTGRPTVDERPPVLALEYAPAVVRPEWVRFGLRFVGGGRLDLVDPRRLGGVELDPDQGRLGPDAMSIRLTGLLAACRSAAPIKAVLLDQARIAGLGNMLADEVLWRASIDPGTEAAALSDRQLQRLADAIGTALPELLERGGSHLGDLAARLRTPGSRCPRDGALLVRRRFGGRTTYSCPVHQVSA